jgi:hypothetical protein
MDSHDRRPALVDYIDIDESLNDALGHVKNKYTQGTHLRIKSSYPMWFGFRYKDQGGYDNKRMKRMGQGFTWKGKEYKIMAGDHYRQGDVIHASHADRLGLLIPRENTVDALRNDWESAPTSPPGIHGGLDLNYAFDDGSVRRYMHVTMNDARMDWIANDGELNQWPNNKLAVPTE